MYHLLIDIITMFISFVCLVLLVKFITCTGSKHCISETVGGANKSVCCADYELKGDDCIACSKGYTSHLGQNCQPCLENTYGERCRYDCFCQDDETCDTAEGCLKIRTSTRFPIHNTSDTTALPGGKNEISTSGSSEEGLLATEIIVYYIVFVTVLNIGVLVCFIFYKYKLTARKKKTTIN